MKGFCIGLFWVTLLMACPLASADAIAQSQATLDWNGLTFTTNGTLVVTTISQAIFQASSRASTTNTSGSTTHVSTSTDSKDSNSFPQTWGNTSASSAYSTSTGNATSQATTAYGFLTSSSGAGATSQRWSSQSEAFTGDDFWLYGTGVGSLIVIVPFTLSVACSVSGPPYLDQSTAAQASVSLEMGPGVGWYTSDTISCQNGSVTKNGALTLSKDFTNPTWGPLVDIEARATTSAVAAVSEPSTLLLLGSGLVGMLGIAKRKLALRQPGTRRR